MVTPEITVAFLRVQLKLSIKLAIIFSNTAITVVKDANVIKTKKSVPQICPNFILIKTLGNVTKISDGPESGATPKAKQAGNIINPLIIATKVSNEAMVIDSLRLVFRHITTKDFHTPHTYGKGEECLAHGCHNDMP